MGKYFTHFHILSWWRGLGDSDLSMIWNSEFDFWLVVDFFKQSWFLLICDEGSGVFNPILFGDGVLLNIAMGKGEGVFFCCDGIPLMLTC